MRKLGIGLQMFTLRNETAADFEGTLRKVKALGYEGVEFAGYGGLSAEALRDLLQELNLTAIGAHISLAAIRDNLAGEIAYLQTIGAKYFICPWLKIEEFQTPEAWKSLFTLLEEAGEACAKAGLIFCYHNHAFEFEQQVDGQFVFDALYASAPSVQVEMDTGWVQFAGQDTLAYIAKYAGRLPLVHLKDYYKGEQGEMVTVELGNGKLPLTDIIAASDKAGSEWIIVEQDRCQNPPLESVETSINWLKSNYLVNV